MSRAKAGGVRRATTRGDAAGLLRGALAAIVLFVLGAAPAFAQTFTIAADPNTDAVSGYRFYRDGSQLGSNGQPTWTVLADDGRLHTYTVSAFLFVVDPTTGTLQQTLESAPGTPVYLQAPCGSQQTVAEYFGSTGQTFARQCVDAVNFNWGLGGPFPGVVDVFSARFTMPVYMPADGAAHFRLTCDDGCRLAVDGQVELDKWFDQAATTYDLDVVLGTGPHSAVILWYENGGEAVIQATVSVPAPPPPPPPTDTIAPTVTLTQPRRSGNSSNYTFQSSATDNVGVTYFRLSLDGSVFSTSATACASGCSLKITAPGSHLLKAEARDAAGNTASTTATVTR